MNRINWVQVGVFAAVVLLVFLIGTSLLGGFGGYRGMMGPGMMGRWGFTPFGWLGALFMWLIPLGFLVLIVAGIVWLVRAAGGFPRSGPQAAVAGGACPSCGRPTQADWQHCPYCGQALTGKA